MSPLSPNEQLLKVNLHLQTELDETHSFEPGNLAPQPTHKVNTTVFLDSDQDGLVLTLRGVGQDTLQQILQFLTLKGPVNFGSDVESYLKIRQQTTADEKAEAVAIIQPAQKPSSLFNIKNKFLQLVNEVIEHHLDNEDFRVSCLSKVMCLCEMQLHRKLKKVVHLSPANYIRKYRLHRSKDFLRDSSMSVSQVSLMVGFRSLEYFSRSFKKEFKISPSAFRKKVQIV